MDTLQKFFPLSFKRTDSVANLIIGLLIYVVVAIAAGFIIFLAGKLTGWIPVAGDIIGWILGVIGALADVYCIAGAAIQLLVFFKVLK